MYLASVGTCSAPPEVDSDMLTNVADVAMGIAYIYQGWGTRVDTVASIYFTTSYLSISLSLNVILTLVIVTRLVRNVRNVRKATGTSGGSSGLHTAAAPVAMMLIESYALYAATLTIYRTLGCRSHSCIYLRQIRRPSSGSCCLYPSLMCYNLRDTV